MKFLTAILFLTSFSVFATSECDLSLNETRLEVTEIHSYCYPSSSDAEEEVERNANLACLKQYNNDPTCKIIQGSERLKSCRIGGSFAESYDIDNPRHRFTPGKPGFYASLAYSVEVPVVFTEKQARKIRCEKAFACLGAEPSKAVIEVVKKIIRTNNCK